MVRLLAAFAAIVLLTQCSYASAGEYGNKDEAVAMVKRVERNVRQRPAPTRRSKRFPTSLWPVFMIATSIPSFTT